MINNIFKKSIAWLLSQAIIYQIIFIIHQFLLLNYAGFNLYGLSSTIFSFIYLIIALLLFGFETVITSFMQKNEAKDLSKKILAAFYGQLIFNIIGAFFCYVFLKNILIFFKYGQELYTAIDNLKITIWLSIIFESYHKMIRNLALLLGEATKSAIIEFSLLIFYLGFVWVNYYFTKTFTLESIIQPFFIQALLSAIIYTIIISSKFPRLICFPYFGNYALRLQGFIALQARGIISGNLLSMLTALTFGFTAASFIKMVSLVVNSLFSLAEKFSLLMLGKLRQEQSLFYLARYINKVIFFVWLLVISIFFIYFFYWQNLNNLSDQFPNEINYWLIIFSYLILTGVELYSYTYEKIALAKNYGLLITIIFIISTLSLILITKYTLNNSYAIFFYMLTRCAFLLSFVYYFKKNILKNY